MVRRVLAPLGDTRVQRWLDTRTFHPSTFPAERLAVERDATVSVCVSIEATAAALSGLVAAGAIDEVVVLDPGPIAAGLAATTGDVVAFLGEAARADAVLGLVGPIVCEPGAAFCLGFASLEDETPPGHPDLAGVRAPRSRELAGRRGLLEGVPHAPGELGLLLVVHAAVGLRGMAQADLCAVP